jgi:hypothetical protein
MEQKEHFSNYKFCTICGRALPLDYELDYCKGCEDEVLFKQVREYIRAHDVTEYELADIFHIPQSKVRKWIREGRIEYVKNAEKLVSTSCQRCGAPVTFGTYCKDCMRLMNGNKEIAYISVEPKAADKGRIRFLDEEKK